MKLNKTILIFLVGTEFLITSAMHLNTNNLPLLTPEEIMQVTHDTTNSLNGARLEKLITMRKQLFNYCFGEEYNSSLPTISDDPDMLKMFDPIKKQILELAIIWKRTLKAQQKNN